MINFKETYNRDEILNFLGNSFLGDFQRDVRVVDIPDQKHIQKAFSLGYSPQLELSIFEFLHEGSTEKRVTLTKEAFNVLRDSGTFKAIGIFHSKDSDDWRFSLMTATPVVNEKGKVKTVLSNPKRFSFLLGPNAKVNTPTKFLITKGEIQDFDDLKERFSIEVVNKEFYKEISELFIQLVGGTLEKGKNKKEYKSILKLPGVKDNSQTAQEFAVRLIGRLIFCWFLREKKNGSEEPLMPYSLLSLEASRNYKNYYHDVLEPIFFKVLNVPLNSRRDEKYASYPYDKIPYLNGGLFSPHEDDFYSINDSKEEKYKEQVIVPDKWFHELFQILEVYNFTIDENSAFDEELSIDPEMLGRIFENLLAEINPETGESARKSTGSYYTPRVIVDYMIDESLYLYLKNKTDIGEEKLRSLISYDLDDDILNPLTKEEGEKIITAIDELKILDPACGSGAFPMGALQKIVFILQQLDPNGQSWFKAQIENVPVELKKNLEREHSEKNFDYIRKLGVIRRNIFGVDIQPIATEISRLRCFLTLIVDQKVDDNKENRGIDPLPNLDFKFVTANSLLSLLEKGNSEKTIGMFEDTDSINRLKDIRDQFFNATNFERNELKVEFKDVQLEMSKHFNSVKNAGADLTEQLLSWNPFIHGTTDWFDSDWMFGVKEGFDIVIGNPPYVHLEKIPQITKKQYQPYYKTYAPRGDIYTLFYEMGIHYLTEDGIITFITSNKWMRASYGQYFRDFLLKKTNPLQLVDLGSGRFSNATVDTNILVVQRADNKNRLKAVVCNGIPLDSIIDHVRKNSVPVSYNNSETWTILTPIEQTIKAKIEKVGIPLKDWKLQINYGIKTGCNEAFIIDRKTRKELIKKDPKSAEIIRPILRGRDIKRYDYDFADLYLVNTHNGIEEKGIPPVDINEYPAIKKHLDCYYDKIKNRNDQGITPYNLRSCTYMEDFNKQVICWQRITHRPTFCTTKKGMIVLDSMAFLSNFGENTKYLLSVLNSDLFSYWVDRNVHQYGENGYRLSNQYVKIFRIPKKKGKDRELSNQEIYELYELTADEINFVSSFVNP